MEEYCILATKNLRFVRVGMKHKVLFRVALWRTGDWMPFLLDDCNDDWYFIASAWRQKHQWLKDLKQKEIKRSDLSFVGTKMFGIKLTISKSCNKKILSQICCSNEILLTLQKFRAKSDFKLLKRIELRAINLKNRKLSLDIYKHNRRNISRKGKVH